MEDFWLDFLHFGMSVNAILAIYSMWPTAYLMYKNKNGDGVSYQTLICSIWIQSFGLADTLYRKNYQHALVYALSLVGCLACLFLKTYYEWKNRKK